MTAFVEQNLIISAIVQLALAVVSIVRRRHRNLSGLYFYYSLGLFGMSFAALMGRVLGHRWTGPVLAVSVVFSMLLYYHFALAFVGENNRARKLVLALQYGCGGFLGLLAFQERLSGALLWSGVAVLGVAPAIYGLEILAVRVGTSFSRLEKRQLSYLMASHTALLLAAALDLGISRWTGSSLSGLWTLGLLALGLATAVNIVRYKFMDLPAMLGWGMAILVAGHLLWIAYSEFVGFIEVRFGNLLGVGAMNAFRMIMATGVFLLLLDPLKKLVVAQMDRVLMRESFDFQRGLTSLSSSLVSILELSEVFERVLRVLASSPRVESAEILLVQGEGEAFRTVFHADGETEHRLDRRSPLVQLLAEGNRILVLDEMERSVQLFYASDYQKLVAAAAKELRELGGELIMPLWFQNKLNGLMILTSSKERGTFTMRERELLLSLASQLGITVENARIYERMRRRDRLAAVGEMATGLAHEIRNPLGAIKAAAQYIEPGMVENEDREFLGILIEEVDRLNNVVTRFLDYARPLRLRLENLDLNQSIQRAITLMAPEAAARNVRIEVRLDPELPTMELDGEQIRQVLLNLLLNGIESMEGGGPIAVSTKFLPSRDLNPPAPDERLEMPLVRGKVVLQVEDDGAGIPPEQIDKIFNPFYTTKGDGTGLGLAITYRIVQAHEGSISVQSEVGVGTTFEIRLPVKVAQEEPPVVEEVETNP